LLEYREEKDPKITPQKQIQSLIINLPKTMKQVLESEQREMILVKMMIYQM